MPVSIKILNKSHDIKCPEYSASMELERLFRDTIPPSVKGTIYIAYGITLCGQSPRDVDILVVGSLENCVIKNFYTNDLHYPKKDLIVDNFCVVFELKDQSYKGVCISNTHVHVEYMDGWKDATLQNEGQRYSFMNYFNNACGYKPFVLNLVWLRSVSQAQLSSMTLGNPIGALPSTFTFNEMVSAIIHQGAIPRYDKSKNSYRLFSTDYSSNFLNDIKSCIRYEITCPPGLTRNKIEFFTQERIEEQLGKSMIGKHLSIFKGLAGTGKTFRLIQSALHLANKDSGMRCLLLTYNHALVSDIRRLLAFLNIPDDIDSHTVQIKTLHSFFMQLMEALNISTKKITGSSFNKEYEKALTELHAYITQLMDEKDIVTLKQGKDLAIDWDYILIDEAQDWMDLEKDILFKVYGSEHLIVADGVDQFMRGSSKQVWNKNVDRVSVEEQKNNLRQKKHIVDFVNALSEELGLHRRMSSADLNYLQGGNVIICKEYDDALHKKLQNSCLEAGCENYDMLFLVPPTMVDMDDNFEKHFSKLKLWNEVGIDLFDGTNDKNREQYPTDTSQCRLFQYDSCRGLEGWVTVCLHFDELVTIKTKEAKKMSFKDSFALDSEDHLRQRFVSQWCLMPLTRPIDTLVIQLTNPDSEIGRSLKSVAEKMPDIVKWII